MLTFLLFPRPLPAFALLGGSRLGRLRGWRRRFSQTHSLNRSVGLVPVQYAGGTGMRDVREPLVFN